MQDLREKTLRGGVARMAAQAASFLLRFGSLMLLARLLDPKDFGLVGMVTAFTGVLNLFRDFGLSAAAVQRTTVTEEQISTLFWINVFVGALLGLASVALAPAVSAFYREPRLLAVTFVLAAGFLFNAAGVQHGALLQRQMRFSVMAVINTASLIVATAIAVGGALTGYGYWALVAMTVTTPLLSTIGSWLATGWIPGRPHRRAGIRSMMRFGGTVTLNTLVVYIASNLEKVLLGRYWGVDAIGIYGRAYQLINIPTENLNSAAGEVAFSALSRLQDDPRRLKSYFLKGYSLVLALTLPLTVACAFFADDIVLVLLGPKWKDAAPILRFLAPTILVFAIANPLSWLLSAIGLVKRNLKLALFIAPTMIAGYLIALPYGPKGVAFAYSAVLVLWVVPLIAWCVRGTVIRFQDIMLVVSRPLASSVVAGVFAFGARLLWRQSSSHLGLLVGEITVLLVVYLAMLLFVAGQRSFYLNLLRGLAERSPSKENALISV
ncbi:MAG: lipopolysaccharide biosynthesis protein [Bryobacteraceae bacterium]|jgi:PST family polysaccharide transporter